MFSEAHVFQIFSPERLPAVEVDLLHGPTNEVGPLGNRALESFASFLLSRELREDRTHGVAVFVSLYDLAV